MNPATVPPTNVMEDVRCFGAAIVVVVVVGAAVVDVLVVSGCPLRATLPQPVNISHGCTRTSSARYDVYPVMAHALVAKVGPAALLLHAVSPVSTKKWYLMPVTTCAVAWMTLLTTSSNGEPEWALTASMAQARAAATPGSLRLAGTAAPLAAVLVVDVREAVACF